MCFSAPVSFTAGVALSAVGISTLKKTISKKEILFAVIPFLFGIQQLVEGGVWLSLQYGWVLVNQILTYSFVLFAYVLWPVFIPIAVRVLETDTWRKKILLPFQMIGGMLGVYLFWFIFSNTITSTVINKSIVYTAPSEYGVILILAYVFATCFSCFVSSNRIVNLLGLFGIVSLAISHYFYTASYASVWCFFAAVLSIIVYQHFRTRNVS